MTILLILYFQFLSSYFISLVSHNYFSLYYFIFFCNFLFLHITLRLFLSMKIITTQKIFRCLNQKYYANLFKFKALIFLFFKLICKRLTDHLLFQNLINLSWYHSHNLLSRKKVFESLLKKFLFQKPLPRTYFCGGNDNKILII